MGFLQNIGTTEIIIIVLVVLLFFGGAIFRGLGKKAGETTKGIKQAKSEFEKAVKEEPTDPKAE
ncbi:MAG TPA: twin-arginine translocase TatA/TatE family subunit [Patescibacteria group bacterium]|nr:twin-arginine translocase TatA/TatE family subunit [Patescibacteria group bacterium]